MHRQRGQDEDRPAHEHDSDDDNYSDRHLSNSRHRRHGCRPSSPKCITVSSLGSISTLCSATLGAGALSLPYAFSLTGLIPGVLLILFSAQASIISIDLIISSCVTTSLYKYEDVAVRLAGSWAGKALEASLLIFCFGTAVAYIMAVGDILDQGLRAISGSHNNYNSDDDHAQKNTIMSIYSRERIMILFWVLVMFPLSLQRNVESLEWVSSLGVLSIIFLVIAAVIHSISHGDVVHNETTHDQGQGSNFSANVSSLLWPDSFWDVMEAFPIIIFAFSCQVNVCAIFEELNSNEGANLSTNNTIVSSKEKAMRTITRLGIALCTILYILMGVFGFLDFANETSDNILTNYCISVTHDPLMISASIFVAVAVVVAYPFNILPARVTLKLIWDRMQRKQACGMFTCLARRIRIICCQSCRNWIDQQADKVDTCPTRNATTRSVAENGNSIIDGLDESNSSAMEPLLVEDESNSSFRTDDHASNVIMEYIPNASSTIEHFALTLLLSGSALVAALIIPNISAVFGLMGGTAASVISFILPGMFLLQMEHESSDFESDVDEDSFSRLISTLSSREMSPSALLQSPSSKNIKQKRRKIILGRSLIIGGSLVGVLSTGVTLHGLFGQNSVVTKNDCVSNSQ
mmetsp:Transcript_7764/g.16616  ORF Transcript_7764/g.16616 Transcript_7764/m.16616 type:complete len:635 (+) Transcript_7764:138-2042(+)